jgi:predicted dehydrogenase
MKARYPALEVHADAEALFARNDIDAVVVATPVATHYALARRALETGRHVLVTKPLADSLALAEDLAGRAALRSRVLMVDHTFLYKGAVRTIRELVRSGALGRPYYYDAVRVNLGLFQHDVNVLWDLAVHDLSILDYVLGAMPRAVSATGIAHVDGRPEDVAYLTCFFEENLIAHLHVNWLAPVKVRKTLIGGDRKMIVYDDLEPDAPVKVFDRGIAAETREGMYAALVGYRTGDLWAPHVDGREALAVEAAHFIDCIRSGMPPLSDAASALRQIRVLEAASRSLALRGAPVEL